MRKIVAGNSELLYDVGQTREIEALARSQLPPHTLMDRAGQAVARLACALAPHARTIWIACGPGNNGGDGLEAAVQLLRLGKTPQVSLACPPEKLPPDARQAYAKARQAGVQVQQAPPDTCDLCIDALLGIGVTRPLSGEIAALVGMVNSLGVPVLSVDVPSGLDASRGIHAGVAVQAQHTLCLLTLKPGLFTGQGRDAAGTVWLDTLLCEAWLPSYSASAELNPKPAPLPRRHDSHKGSYGDVAVVGGASGMTGAAVLAGTAALHGGAGRVYLDLLGAGDGHHMAPDLMLRPVAGLDPERLTVVCGCGGGQAVESRLAGLLSAYSSMVIDADAINFIANETSLQRLLRQRQLRGWRTVLTPHPLEAARLLSASVSEVQADRLSATQQLVARFGCTVVLKGSGSVIQSPGERCSINPSGNARLAVAGTGDVLAGLIGAGLACGLSAHQAARSAVYQHGELADRWPEGVALSASRLAGSATAT